MKVAIMQPYFIPYAGYFRLFHAVDLFVIYDCVQFTRRGYIHRNQLLNSNGEATWLTLPLARAPQDILISALTFSSDAKQRMQEQTNKFPIFKNDRYLNNEFNQKIMDFSVSPVRYITHLLKLTCSLLNLNFNVVHSSELNIPSELKGQDRILFIAKHFKTTEYINAPVGRSLYDAASFGSHNIKLTFLSDYEGPKQSILARLFSEDLTILRKEIISQCQ